MTKPLPEILVTAAKYIADTFPPYAHEHLTIGADTYRGVTIHLHRFAGNDIMRWGRLVFAGEPVTLNNIDGIQSAATVKFTVDGVDFEMWSPFTAEEISNLAVCFGTVKA